MNSTVFCRICSPGRCIDISHHRISIEFAINGNLVSKEEFYKNYDMKRGHTITRNNVRIPAVILEPCNSSHVEVSRKLTINGINHAGTVAHRCGLIETHEGPCVCPCGERWRKWIQKS